MKTGGNNPFKDLLIKMQFSWAFLSKDLRILGTSKKGPVWEFLLWKNIIRRDYFCNKCQYNIIFGKIDIYVPLPPAYIREVWDNSKANAENIKKAIYSFNWNKVFENLSTNAKVELLNETLEIIFQIKKLSATTVTLRGWMIT